MSEVEKSTFYTQGCMDHQRCYYTILTFPGVPVPIANKALCEMIAQELDKKRSRIEGVQSAILSRLQFLESCFRHCQSEPLVAATKTLSSYSASFAPCYHYHPFSSIPTTFLSYRHSYTKTSTPSASLTSPHQSHSNQQSPLENTSQPPQLSPHTNKKVNCKLHSRPAPLHSKSS